MTKLFQRLQNAWARLTGKSIGDDPEAVLIKRLIGSLEMAQEGEPGCEEVFEVVDEYAELILRGEDAQALMPKVHHHMESCGACREELELLIEMLSFDPAQQADLS